LKGRDVEPSNCSYLTEVFPSRSKMNALSLSTEPVPLLHQPIRALLPSEEYSVRVLFNCPFAELYRIFF
jgi:hypothetical protein